MVNISQISAQSFFGKLLRLPLSWIPPGLVVPILQGRLRGYKWITDSSINGCWLGSYEYQKRQLFEKVITPGSVVFDIGAHVGYYTLLSAVLVGHTGMVFAFEPNPGNLSLLKRHLVINSLTNVKIMDMAVSDRTGSVHFDNSPHSSMGHISPTGTITVRTDSLDNLYAQQKVPAPDVIKIDVEGAELSVLRGGKNLLSTHHPVIFLATHGQDIHRDCCNFLKSAGYTVELIDDYKNEILAFV